MYNILLNQTKKEPFNWHYHRKTITKVFKFLRKKKNGGFCALQRNGGGPSNGWCEIDHVRKEKSENIVFYHWQNWFDFKLDGQLYLNWRGDGNAIVSAFKNENLDVEWDGSDDKCIIINFQYRKKK